MKVVKSAIEDNKLTETSKKQETGKKKLVKIFIEMRDKIIYNLKYKILTLRRRIAAEQETDYEKIRKNTVGITGSSDACNGVCFHFVRRQELCGR